MLKIRLARGWKHKAPFYRIVLTEHTKPVQSGYQEVLGWFDPLHHKSEMNIDLIKEWIWKGAQPSNRVAKLARKFSDDKFFDAYITHSDRVRRGKNEPEPVEEEVEAPTPAEEATPEAPATETETPAETPEAAQAPETAQAEETPAAE